MLGINLPKVWRSDIAVDLGTSKTALFLRGEGVVYDEPSVIAFQTKRSGTRVMIAVGEEALRMEGKEPSGIKTVRPLSGGVIEKLDVTKLMLTEVGRRAGLKRGLMRPKVLVGAPFAISDIERRAVNEAGFSFAAGSVEIIAEPLAAAIGSDIDISESVARMIVDVGGGITEVVVVSLGDIVHSESIRVGGDSISQSLIAHLKRRHQITVGTQTANLLKETLCRADDADGESFLMVRGTGGENQLPISRQVRLADLATAMRGTLTMITAAVKRAFENTPPMLAGDLVDNGIVLTGGGALLLGLKAKIEDETGVTVHIATDPRRSVIRGGGCLIEGHLPNNKRT